MLPETKAAPGRRVFLVDDSHWVLRGLEVLIEQAPDLEVCGAADNVADGLEGILRKKPDIAIIDLRLRGGEGRGLIESLRRDCPQVKILVFSMYDDAYHAQEALGCGAHGYMSKKELAEKVVPVLRQILAGESYVSASLSGAARAKREFT